jgi:hypothetical protein
VQYYVPRMDETQTLAAQAVSNLSRVRLMNVT